jgi:hypothetical protein
MIAFLMGTYDSAPESEQMKIGIARVKLARQLITEVRAKPLLYLMKMSDFCPEQEDTTQACDAVNGMVRDMLDKNPRLRKPFIRAMQAAYNEVKADPDPDVQANERETVKSNAEKLLKAAGAPVGKPPRVSSKGLTAEHN